LCLSDVPNDLGPPSFVPRCDNADVSRVDLLRLRSALEASWDSKTSFRGEVKPGNPAYGQCYPSARVVQHFFPDIEIAEGQVWTGQELERHFWNVLDHEGTLFHIDLSWQQFPIGSSVHDYALADRSTIAESPETVSRVEILLRRVEAWLDAGSPAAQ
jgi:hypothetical protein